MSVSVKEQQELPRLHIRSQEDVWLILSKKESAAQQAAAKIVCRRSEKETKKQEKGNMDAGGGTAVSVTVQVFFHFYTRKTKDFHNLLQMIHWKANLGWWKRPSFLFQQSSVDEAKPGADLGPVVAEPALQSLTIGVVLSHHHQPCRIVDESSWAIFSKLRSSSVIEYNPSWRVMGPVVAEPALQSHTIGVNLSCRHSSSVIISHVDESSWAIFRGL